jgi:4-hydroxyproline epimerase
MPRVRVVDSHTEGEPTRMVVSGGPDLGSGSLARRRERFRAEFDWFRRALVTEPRGAEVAVGALLVPPVEPRSLTGVIFFNNVGYLGMCGHGTIGIVASLAHLGRARPGSQVIETPVGAVRSELNSDGSVSFENVESWCARRDVTIQVPGYGKVVGDVAWGGNWFFLLDGAPCDVARSNISALTAFTTAVQAALTQAGVTGADGIPIDHIEVSGPAGGGRDGRNFVRCPGGMYDRSPCGTGTSAKLASLFARGKFAPGQVWRQEGIMGGVFEGSIIATERGVIPRITGKAYVTAEAELVLDDGDPFRFGFPS